MRAVVATGYGPPEQYTVADMPVPRPGPGQIQVRIAAASVNPADIVIPSGDYRDFAPLEFPHIPGNDFAGTVTEAGPGVTAYRAGEEIFGQSVPRALRAMAGATRPSLSTGTLAEYAVFEADTPLLARRPPGLPAEQAAALATTGLTACDDIALHFVLDMDGTLGGMREVGELAAHGGLRATIARRYTLDEGPQACTDFARQHTTGKLVVTM